MRPEQTEGRASNAAPQENQAGISLVERTEGLKACGQAYQTFGRGVMQCGRPASHDGSHHVDCYPFDPRPVREHELTEIEQILAAAGWHEMEQNIWRAPWAPGTSSEAGAIT